jgi:peptide/nickel transport system substrate-binding protein
MFLQHTLSRRATLRTMLAGAAVIGAGAPHMPAAAAERQGLYGPIPDNPKRGGRLNMGLLLEPPGLDPFHQGADARIRLTVLIYQGLFYEAASGTPEPLLAESYTVSDDGLLYTIKIRQGVKFHDGTPMTAADVAYSYNYVRDSRNGSPGAGDYSTVVEFKAVDPATVQIRLNTPNASLPMTMGNKYGGVVPAGYFDRPNADKEMSRKSVGTGPFKLTDFVPNSYITLDRHTEYWEKGVPYLDGIDMAILPNSASMLVALRNNRVDFVKLSRPQDAEQLKGIKGVTVQRWPSLSQAAIDIGSELAPLGDVRVRQAISLAIDKKEMMHASIGEYGTVLGTVPAGMQAAWGLPLDKVPMQGPDIAAAKRKLAEAGKPNGFPLKMTIINGYDWMDPASVTLRQQLAKIGIALEIQKIDLGVWIKNFQSHNMGFTFNDWPALFDPNLLYYRHFHKRPLGADFRNWNNDEASRLLDEGRATSDVKKRHEIYDRFQKIFAETAPSIMLYSADHVTVRNARVHNYEQHPTGWYYGLARTWIGA